MANWYDPNLFGNANGSAGSGPSPSPASSTLGAMVDTIGAGNLGKGIGGVLGTLAGGPIGGMLGSLAGGALGNALGGSGTNTNSQIDIAGDRGTASGTASDLNGGITGALGDITGGAMDNMSGSAAPYRKGGKVAPKQPRGALAIIILPVDHPIVGALSHAMQQQRAA